MPAAAIFDMDGLLADTERLHARAYIDALAHFGHRLDETAYAEHWIRHGLGIDAYVAAHGLPLDPAEVRRHKMSRFDTLLHTELAPMPGAHEILARLGRNMPLALATSSSRSEAARVLDGLGWRECFAVIVTGDDVPRVKPHPDIFLRAASLLGEPGADCIVLEDAEKGIVAAHRAGMPTIAIPTPLTASNDFTLATHRCQSLAEAAELIERM